MAIVHAEFFGGECTVLTVPGASVDVNLPGIVAAIIVTMSTNNNVIIAIAIHIPG